MLSLSLVLAMFGVTFPAQAQDHPSAYPTMARIDQYLMPDRDAEIALARTAAPEAISHDATVMVLTQHGYQTAAQGKNGFVCVVERAWMSPFDSPEFWNPKNRSPICYNPPAARSALPMTLKRTGMVLSGKSKAQIIEGTKASFEKKEMPELEPGAMSYMMSKNAYLTDNGDHNLAHVMFYAPHMDPAAWGADLPNSPLMLPLQDAAVPIDVVVVPVGRWSDGTAAPVM
jgi:hypothetical protein